MTFVKQPLLCDMLKVFARYVNDNANRLALNAEFVKNKQEGYVVHGPGKTLGQSRHPSGNAPTTGAIA